MRYVRLFCCVLFVLSLLLMTATAQDSAPPFARWQAPSQAVLVGEPFLLQLEIMLSAESELIDPALPVVWGDFWLRPLTPMESSVTPDGLRQYRQDFTATLWRTGQLATPPLTLQYRGAGGVTQTLDLLPARVQVDSVLNPDDLNLRGSRPPLTMPYIAPLTLVVAGGLLGAAAFLLWRGWRKRSRLLLSRTSMTAARLALDELNRAARLDDPIQIHVRVADALRGFVGARAGFPVLDLTTEELFQRLPINVIPEPRRLELQQLLDYADLVKFAQLKPPNAQRILAAARRWLTDMERGSDA
jgi:hypothetical protein